MENLKKFLASRKAFILASALDEQPWVANLYYATDDSLNFYFVSSIETRHSKEILKNSKVAFSVVWYDESNLGDRKAIQGEGTCEVVKDHEALEEGLKHYYKAYPGSEKRTTVENMIDENEDRFFWKVTPKYIKFWDDESGESEEDKLSEFKF